MTSFTFTAEQVRSAPPEVRRWMENQVAAALGAFEPAPHRPAPSPEPALSACSPEEAAHLLGLIGSDTPAGRIFLELGRKAIACAGTSLSAVSIGEFARRLRLATGDHLIKSLSDINTAFQNLRGTAGARFRLRSIGPCLYSRGDAAQHPASAGADGCSP